MKRNILPWEEWKQQLNWEKVSQAILSIENDQLELTSVDYEMAAGMCMDTAAHFVPLDMAAFEILGVEKAGEYGPGKTKYIIDLLLRVKKDAIKPYCDYSEGTLLVVDWKSTANHVDDNWRRKYIRSWQSRIYCVAEDALLAEYRGVSWYTDPPLAGEHETKALLLEMPATNKQEVDEYLAGAEAMAASLSPLEVYPRKIPKACGAWGRDCQFLNDCISYTMPRQKLDNPQLSFSSIENLFECPEKYRRLKISKDEETGSSLTVGQALHRGMAEVYTQLQQFKD